MLIDELPLPLLPGGHIPPHHLQWDHHHVPGGVSRQLKVLSHWAGCVCCLSTVLVLLEPDVQGSARLSHILLPAGVLGAGQQVQAALVCAGDVLDDGDDLPCVVDGSLLHHHSGVRCSTKERTQ